MIGRTPEEQAYLDAWVDLANMPSAPDRSVAQEADAQRAKLHLDEAELNHYNACIAARGEPETEAERAGRLGLEESIERQRERDTPDLEARIEREREAEAAAEAEAEREVEDPEAEIG
jgi:hypothetical protein